MSNSGSTGSYTDSTGLSLLGDSLQIPNYHFKSQPIPSLVYGENVDIVFGYRISNKKPVIAKISGNSLKLEREYYIMKRLYQLTDGGSFLVRPLDYIHLPTGLTVVIYADEGHNYLDYHLRQSDDTIKQQQGTSREDYVNSNSGPLFDLGTFLRFAIKCTDCLEFIHKNNVVHGEIKLSAFQWSGEDSARVKLWNFGSGSKSFETYLTSEGWRKTAHNRESFDSLQHLLAFMSPEQTGRTTYVPDHRSDIYSLGVVFFVLLTGKIPFDGGPLDILNSISPDDRYNSAYGMIELFPLAERDVASFFTLPKTIYGRQPLIVEMTYVIQHTASVFKSTGSKRDKSHGSGSTVPTITSASDLLHHQRTLSDSASETALSNHDLSSFNTGTKSNTSPSYCSGSDYSGGNGRLTSGKQGVEIVCLSGPGGVGKSTLFNAVQTVARQEGYVASAKFDSRHKVPYSCILKSLSQILQQILSESEEEIHAFYNHLKSHLGSQFCKIELLADLVPELKPLLDPVDSEESEGPIDIIHLDNVETRVRFHTLFIEVFRALSQWRMITLFLDDIHLADEPSVELIETMIGSRLKILLFLAYRDEEITTELEKLLCNDTAVFHFYKVDLLDLESLVNYIGDALHRPLDISRDSILPLAEIIYRKTRGNAFYTAQLLTTLEKKRLIFFNWEENEWDYNLADIQQLVLTNDGADRESELDISFLVSRLRELPLDGQRLLKWASFVGDTFSWNTVKYLMVHSDPDSEFSDAGTVCSDMTDTADTVRHPLLSFSSSSSNRTTRSHGTSSYRGSSSSTRDPINGLQAALQEGYILPLESDEFKWSHDRYSQAAMELANPKSREKIHFKIAKYLLQGNTIKNDNKRQEDKTHNSELDQNGDHFLIADHLLKCIELLTESEEKGCYRSIFYEAGNKARNSGAHKMALDYFKAAIVLMDPDCWQSEQYATTHFLYTNAVALSWVVGEYDFTEKYLDVIFQNTTDPLDRVAAYRIQYKYHFSRQMHIEGAMALHECLKELDIKDFKWSYTRTELDEEFERVKALIDQRGFEEIKKVEVCEDIKLKAIMSVLEEMCTVAYWLGNQIEMFYLATKLVHISIDHGVSQVSGVALIFMGLAAVECYGLFKFGEELGAAGMFFTDKFGSNYEKGRAGVLYANFLMMWKHHYRDQIPWYRSALKYSLSAGDRIYASFAHLHVAMSMLFTGENLSDTLIEAENCFNDIHAWSSSSDSNILIMSVIRTIKALQGHTFNSSPELIFDGEDGFNDQHFISESCKQSSNPSVPMNWYDSFRMLPLVLYGHYDHAIAIGYMCIQGIHYHPCHRHTRLMLMLHSLAIIEKIRSEGLKGEAVDLYMERVRANQEMLKVWVDHSAINCSMWYTLVQAEIASLSDDIKISIILYERAIDEARQGDWYLELCICHEYAGAFYERFGMKNTAYGLLKKAIGLYVRHGSYGKANQLTTKYSSLLSEFDDDRIELHDIGIQTDPFPFLNPQGSWSTSSLGPIAAVNEPFVAEVIPPVTTEQTLMTLDILDMASILKSSQVISSEVKFDSLLKSMMSIILENSGADCGAIIVKEEKYGVCAYGSQQEGAMTFDPPRPLSDKDNLISSRVVNHTINTSESIFIHNVEQDARFALGSWYEKTGNKSVICMPIVHKGTMVGCLFIEGSIGIFTQRHITVLSLLCQQMGISITNAFLFKSVQRVTKANMRMIEMQKKALEDARKSKEAAIRATRLREIFLANMSHEIRTPFSGFYGMISLLADTQLDPEQRDLVKTAKESCEMLLQIIDDLLNFSKLQAGKVTLDLSPIVVEDIIADVVEMLIAMAIQKNINIAYIVAPTVPSVVMADGNRLRQILINLLGNAIKFTHEGEIRIQCSLDKSKRESDDQASLLFEVIDTGIGISNEQRKVLFEPFSQVDGSTTRKYGGTGLGLSICLQLVELMGGSIDVSSVPNKGSNFFFSIRVSNLRSQPNGKNVQMEGYVEEQKALLRNIARFKAVALSKYDATIQMIRHFLPGVHVDDVMNIEEFEKMVKRNHYDIIIIGLFMNPENQQMPLTWLEEASKVNKDAVVVIMNYPAGGVNQKSRWIEPVSSQQLACKTVRMAVPMRRMKLLKAIDEALNKTALASTTSSAKTKPDPLITDKERGLYSQMNILIAEDNPVAQKLLFKQLTRLGFHVECANNGLEAVDAWINRPTGYFSMAFFDHHMPKCDGVAATKRIREIEREEGKDVRLPIVALTADVQESARQICIKAGMDGYLTKPLNQKVLAEALRRYCLSLS
ncbi:hypothetical protein RO3G_16486 [Rhizopus delemar RA 99-880]|uniref:histidine kinase n=1 Tax=Rhizopus delemar (strain RA 99-880 / ATCC MYA-4621 / FGSC 9543 / NRRL 43880) TaxID=246409 RepID=I1CTJ5_RHIO9|nr:hypothetical protein RO3G_16486 [Rhizopus delemar RA 99-880]|eukprot:EIE91775.1 hypothetical protein RO3G_16486 [Rhizopus delemar RA 99-880]